MAMNDPTRFETDDDRNNILITEGQRLASVMRQSGFDDPVGIVFCATDPMAQQMFRAAMVMGGGLSDEQASAYLQSEVEQLKEDYEVPMGLLVVSWKVAEQLLSPTSPLTKRRLRFMRPLCNKNLGKYLGVSVATQGNAYGVIKIPNMPRQSQPIEDGQHRFTGVYFPKR